MSGFILESRSILNSDIWSKPPLYFKVWHYLLLKARFKDDGNLKRGQLFTSLNEIREACTYHVGYRKVTPSKQEIHRIFDWLRSSCEDDTNVTTKEPMIRTTKVTHGMIVTIVNYDIYQDKKFYERDSEQDYERTTNGLRTGRQRNNIKEKGEKRKKEKKEEDILSAKQTPYTEITDLYHQNCKSLPMIKKLSDQRKARLRNLYKTYGLDDFETVFAKAEESEFLSGRSGRWSGCGFDWLTKPTNFLKVLEGNYDNKKESDSLKIWAEGGVDEQEADSDIIDISSFSIS